MEAQQKAHVEENVPHPQVVEEEHREETTALRAAQRKQLHPAPTPPSGQHTPLQPPAEQHIPYRNSKLTYLLLQDMALTSSTPPPPMVCIPAVPRPPLAAMKP